MKSGLLLSGGMDSLCIAWWLRPQIAFTVDYGQLAAGAEITASREICDQLEIEHHTLYVDCRAFGSGDMAGAEANEFAPATDWWPYRNQMLVTFAAMKAIGLGVNRLLLGSVRSDGSHKDGTTQFISSMSHLLAIQEGGLLLEAPAIEFSTAELIRHAGVPMGLLAWAHSCHSAEVACGRCRGCNKYFTVLQEIQGEVDQLGEPSAAAGSGAL